jgi:two-component system chemotaxis response regulator CheB
MKVLMVEDSATVAAYITAILGAEADMQLLPVAGTAKDGVRMAKEARPDVILMDMKLPDHDGLWAIEQIMVDDPCPIVVLSGYLSVRERDITFESLRAGAVEVLAKPQGLSPQVREAFRVDLIRTLRLMRTAVVVKRRAKSRRAESTPIAPSIPRSISREELVGIRGVLVGASTGGPELLHRTLSALPKPFPLPLLITQHTLEGFDESLADWLSSTGHRVKIATEGQYPEAGLVLLAPADKHLALSLSGVNLVATRRGEASTAIDTMFASAARVWGERALAVILTGMGRDGTAGLRALYERGAFTVAQSAETCVVASMPDSARAASAVRHVMHPDQIAGVLIQLAKIQTAQPGTFERDKRS